MTVDIDAIQASDETLWKGVIAGDAIAFRSVVQRYQSVVSAIAFGIVGEFASSQDIAQETFWAAWKSRNSLREPHRLGGWLCGIARNLAREDRRSRHKSESLELHVAGEPAADDADPLERTISAEEESIVWSSLQELPESYREVLALYYRQGKTAAEVANALELSEDAVKQRLSRGRAMLREHVATVIEDVLVHSRPGRGFTTKVMAGIVGVAAAQGSGSAMAATLTSAAGGAASGAASVAVKSIFAAGAAGLAGGLLGALGGLGGAYLGTWLPGELAPTAAERTLLRKSGRKMWIASILYTIAMLGCTPLLFLPRGWVGYLGIVALLTVTFLAIVIVQSLRMQRSIRELRATLGPAPDPNPSLVKKRLEAALSRSGKYRWLGRRYTSPWTLFGLPLIDVQVSDPSFGSFEKRPSPGIARGWIAIGDRAHGILVGIGGYAHGAIAIGGAAIGLLSFGGLSLGVVGVGGLALGALSIGGLAVGHTALGGAAVGWTAAGGAAVGWHSAAGGLAVAYHAAMGGLAVARDFAVGGTAYAAEVNTPAARDLLKRESLQWILDLVIAHPIWFHIGVIAVSLSGFLPMRFMYRRAPSRS